MIPKDPNDLSEENIGWLRAFENEHISDEELKKEVEDILESSEKEEQAKSPVEASHSSSLKETLKQSLPPQQEQQKTFDELSPDFFKGQEEKRLTHYELEDLVEMPRIKGWRHKMIKGRE